MRERWLRPALVFALQLLAALLLVLALAGVHTPFSREAPRWLVLLDRSASVPASAAEAALTELARKNPVVTLEVLEFAGRPAGVVPLASVLGDSTERRAAIAGLDPSASNLERALHAALEARNPLDYAAIVVVSDGRFNAGDTPGALRAARDAGLTLHWLGVARPAPRAWIADLQAPTEVPRGQGLTLAVPIAGKLGPGLRLQATLRTPDGATHQAAATPDARGLARLELPGAQGGPLRVALTLIDGAGGAPLDERPDALLVDVVEPARILYLNGASGPLAGSLATSLRAGGWSLEYAPAQRAIDYRERLAGFEAVILDDVARGDADDAFWTALASQVRDRGLGLLVLGGERAFARGGYRGSTLESLLPVLAEPAALGLPARVVFAVDKSGSMGEGSGGVDRLGLAERAVRATLATLGERDSAAVLTFDVESRLLQGLAPAPGLADRLTGTWPVSAGGGTRLAPALELATEQLENAPPGRRLLVLVTDGFVDEAPLAALQERLAAARIELVALAVGADADIAALQRLAAATGGLVLRVAAAAELPDAMSRELERQRERVVRDRVPALATDLPPALGLPAGAWPPVAAHAPTRLRPAARAWVRTRRNDPLLAAWQSGAGRVVAITSGLGAWTPEWLSWQHWPALAGGLTAWVANSPGSAAAALRVRDTDRGLQLTVDLASAGGWQSTAPTAATVLTPSGQTRQVALAQLAPGRFVGLLEDPQAGPHRVVVDSGQGLLRTLHLRSARLEQLGWGTDPRVQDWQRAGLVETREPQRPGAARRPAHADRAPPDRGLVTVALLLFCAGLLLERWPRRA